MSPISNQPRNVHFASTAGVRPFITSDPPQQVRQGGSSIRVAVPQPSTTGSSTAVPSTNPGITLMTPAPNRPQSCLRSLCNKICTFISRIFQRIAGLDQPAPQTPPPVGPRTWAQVAASPPSLPELVDATTIGTLGHVRSIQQNLVQQPQDPRPPVRATPQTSTSQDPEPLSRSIIDSEGFILVERRHQRRARLAASRTPINESHNV
jgi:hypothetical protein